MTILEQLRSRSDNQCELCLATDDLSVFDVPPDSDATLRCSLLICNNCRTQIDGSDSVNADHWRCLNTSMWSEIPAVQVMAWRMLKRMSNESWAQELLDMLYLDEETLVWAQNGVHENDEGSETNHKDSNGASLKSGDTVTLIKDLNVKGAGFTAKRGTAVRSISLVTDNPLHIEGRVNGQQVVILTEFVKKSG